MKKTFNNIELNYIEEGMPEGRPLIFIHAFPLNHTMWRRQINHFKASWRCIAYDIRGLGDSGTGDGQYTMEVFTDDLRALMDGLGIDTAVLCGLSMGGYIALRMAERYPERVAGLILADTRTEGDTNEGKIKRTENMIKVKSGGTHAFADDMVKNLLWEGTLREKGELTQQVKQMIKDNETQGVAGCLLAMAARTDTTEALKEFKKPVLILVGEHDGITPPIVAQGMHEMAENSAMHVIQGAGHLSNLEGPDEFNRHMDEFLKAKLSIVAV